MLAAIALLWGGSACTSLLQSANERAMLNQGEVTNSESTETAEYERLGDAFGTSEDYWITSPWFNVSSFVLTVRSQSAQTQILIHESSPLFDYMSADRNVIADFDTDVPSRRFFLGLCLSLGDTPAFVDHDRVLHPELY